MEDFEAVQRASLSPSEKKNRMVGRSPADRLQGLKRMFQKAQEGKVHERLSPVVENLRKQAQLTDDRSEKGIYLGLAVSALKPASNLAKAGVQNGDRIVAINTVPITYQGRLKPNIYPMFVPGRPFDMKLLGSNGKLRVVKVEREPGSMN
jgi:S1-C subfamily serine protease